MCLNPKFAEVIDKFTVGTTYFLALNKNFWEQHFKLSVYLHYLYIRKVIDLVPICNPTAGVFFIWFCLVGWFRFFGGLFGFFKPCKHHICKKYYFETVVSLNNTEKCGTITEFTEEKHRLPLLCLIQSLSQASIEN